MPSGRLFKEARSAPDWIDAHRPSQFMPSGRSNEEARSAPDWIDSDIHPKMRPPGDQMKRREARLTGFEPVTVRLEEQWSFHNSLIFNGYFFPILPIFAIS
jgi:hypothetical protein